MISFKYSNHSITTNEKKCRKYRGKWLGRRKEGKNKLDSASFPKNRFDNCETLILVAHAWCSTWWWSLCLLIDWFHMTNFTQPYTLFIRVNKIPFRITLSLLLVLLYHLLTQFNLPQSHARLMTFFLPFKFISKTILHM